MKNPEKRVLFQSLLIVFFSFCFVAFVAVEVDGLKFDFGYKILAQTALVILFLILSYIVTNFILYSLFKTNKTLDNLLKNTLHELNVPLSTIKANTQLLHVDAKDKDKKRLERIKKASEHLYRLYEEVDYHIKREIVPIKKEVFDVKDIVQESAMQIENTNKNITLTYDLTPMQIETDKIGFYKVISNLLSNAYKYNKPNGSVHLSLKDDRFCIKDSGIGMSEEARFRLFDRYYQADKEASGYGIGLNIVKSFCDENGIFIKLTSKENQGTLVCLSLEHLKVGE